MQPPVLLAALKNSPIIPETINISLKKREFAAVEILRNVLSKGKEKLLGSITEIQALNAEGGKSSRSAETEAAEYNTRHRESFDADDDTRIGDLEDRNRRTISDEEN